jgi:hypothetical protein
MKSVLQRSHAAVFPPRVFDSAANGKAPVKPKRFVRWYNVDHLRAFSGEDRTKINILLKDNGLKIVEFDELIKEADQKTGGSDGS